MSVLAISFRGYRLTADVLAIPGTSCIVMCILPCIIQFNSINFVLRQKPNSFTTIIDKTLFVALWLLLSHTKSYKCSIRTYPFTLSEEILHRQDALWWSPDGNLLLYGHFNDTEVGKYGMTMYGPLKNKYVENRRLPYPKVSLYSYYVIPCLSIARLMHSGIWVGGY